MVTGQFGHEAVLRRARKLDDSPACHEIGVYIDRINGVRDSHHTLLGKQFLEVACVALRSITDEYLVRLNIDAVSAEVILYNCFAQEVIATFRAIAAERCCHSHLVHGLVQSLHNSRSKRLRHVAYSQ